MLAARALCEARQCRFEETLRHQDQGWEHYGDQWQVVTHSGELLWTRTLYREQPFTRSLDAVRIPAGGGRLWVVPRDSVHGMWARYPVVLERTP